MSGGGPACSRLVFFLASVQVCLFLAVLDFENVTSLAGGVEVETAGVSFCDGAFNEASAVDENFVFEEFELA